MRRSLLILGVLASCDAGEGPPVVGPTADAGALVVDAGAPFIDAGPSPDAGPSSDAGSSTDAGVLAENEPWADRVVGFEPGPGAGFGQDRFPGVVLGPPRGGGASLGSLDVLSLGQSGSITLELTDLELVDGPGVDLLVFENPFVGFTETGVVAVSDDGLAWREFPCAAVLDGGTEGCAGVNPVFADPDQGISGTDPVVAGGDGFDLAEVGVTRARFVRIRDSGANRPYGPPGGGFDLDAIAVVNGAPR